MKEIYLETRMLTRFKRTEYSSTEIYTVTQYYTDGTITEFEEIGRAHFITPIIV